MLGPLLSPSRLPTKPLRSAAHGDCHIHIVKMRNPELTGRLCWWLGRGQVWSQPSCHFPLPHSPFPFPPQPPASIQTLMLSIFPGYRGIFQANAPISSVTYSKSSLHHCQKQFSLEIFKPSTSKALARPSFPFILTPSSSWSPPSSSLSIDGDHSPHHSWGNSPTPSIMRLPRSGKPQPAPVPKDFAVPSPAHTLPTWEPGMSTFHRVFPECFGHRELSASLVRISRALEASSVVFCLSSPTRQSTRWGQGMHPPSQFPYSDFLALFRQIKPFCHNSAIKALSSFTRPCFPSWDLSDVQEPTGRLPGSHLSF